jgi:hypothetical protein
MILLPGGVPWLGFTFDDAAFRRKTFNWMFRINSLKGPNSEAVSRAATRSASASAI